MSWYIPFAKLSQTQQACIESATRHVADRAQFISGFAGSGKSVVLAHTMERLRADNPTASFAFLSFTNALVGMAKAALASAGLDRRLGLGIEFSTVHAFLRRSEPVDFIFVDEVQDLEVGWLESLKARARNVILAGDYEQALYERGAAMTDMLQIFSPHVHELREVHRLTPSLKKVALALNPIAGRIVEADPVNSVDADIREIVFDDFSREVEWVTDEAIKRARAGSPSALLFGHHLGLQQFFLELGRIRGVDMPKGSPSTLQERYLDLNDSFKAADIPLSYFGNGAGTLKHGEVGPHCYLMTIHSAKGLDFKNVFLPGLQRSDPNRKPTSLSPRVCFVGVTRSVENLFLSRTGDAVAPPFDKLPIDVVTRIQPSNAMTDELIFF